MTSPATLSQARDAFAREAWAMARAAYASLADIAPFTLDDLERYATAARLAGDEPECRDAFARGYREALRVEDRTRAARFAFWTGHTTYFMGESAQAGGWYRRGRSLLGEIGADCVEWGYLLVADGIDRLFAGELAAARRAFTDAQAIGNRFADPDLLAMARHGLGRTLLRLGMTGEGMRVLDEVMVAVTSGEVSPLIVGDVYCGVLEACREAFDLPRAREWTAALSRWCEDKPELVPYRGPCMVYRVEMMRFRGDWEDALEEARRACDWLSLPSSPEGPAEAFYQLGELYRLRGDHANAEDAYRQASRLGRLPEPGCALLWLARGQCDAAASAVARALDEAVTDSGRRAELLAAYVEILLAARDTPRAQTAASELGALAGVMDALAIRALADRAEGSALIASGQPRAALAPLRRAWVTWKQLDAPYEGARTRALIAAACRALGDDESAAMELDAARWVFERLGAGPDLARLGDASSVTATEGSGGLTPREVEVLALIAAGKTNKAIAAALVISEHTVARHVQNMLQKLGFSSRTGLAAFAVGQGLAKASPGQN